jgi:hypothetical protein
MKRQESAIFFVIQNLQEFRCTSCYNCHLATIGGAATATQNHNTTGFRVASRSRY